MTGKTFVVVHGAWHGAWCWHRVAARLTARGHRVVAPILSGLGERSHLLDRAIDLSTHIRDIVNELRWKDLDQVVLVGHSYGGMVITGALEQLADRVASAVYVDAFVPRDGESVAGVLNWTLPHRVPRVAGGAIAPPSAAALRVNDADRRWVDSKLTPQPIATFMEPLRVTGRLAGVRRRTFIAVADGESCFARMRDRCLAEAAWTVHHVDGGHDVMIDRPAELSRLLELASEG